MENTLRDKAIKAIKAEKSEIKTVTSFIKKDRFVAGRESLQKWYKIGGYHNRLKVSKAFNRKELLPAFHAMLEIDENEISKYDRAASSTLATYEWSDLIKWYLSKKKFAVSPRTILRDYGAYLNPKTDTPEDGDGGEDGDKTSEKTDFQKITEALSTARKLLEKGIDEKSLKADDLKQIKQFAAGIDKLIK